MLKKDSLSPRTSRLCIGFLLSLSIAVSGFASNGADPSAECKRVAGDDPYVCFDHANKAWIQPVGEITRDGAPLKLVIINTDPDHIVAIAREVPAADAQAQGQKPVCPSLTKVQTIFPKGEGRYTLEIAFDQSCTGLESVAPTEFRVDVLGWEQSVAGGFVGSEHRNQQFSAYTRQVNNAAMTFVEEEPSDRRDDLRLGLSSFIHLYNERIERWAEKGQWARNLLPAGFSFGLGIGEQNRTTYSLGPAWRFGNKGFLNVGYSWAPVDRLPNGIRTCPRSSQSCDPTFAISDPSRIATPSQHTKGAWFASVSYTFITLGAFFEDRFRDAIKASAAPAASQQAATSLKDEDLELTCTPKDNKAGAVVTMTAKVKKSGSTPLRLEIGPQFEPLPDAERGDWVQCSDAAAGNPNRCFELATGKIVALKDYIFKPKLTAAVAPGLFNPKLSAGTTGKKFCDVVVTP